MNRLESYKTNQAVIMEEARQIEKEAWEKNRFCNCTAENIAECSCDESKKWRFMERVNRKINKQLGEKAVKLRFEKWKLQKLQGEALE